MCGRGKFSTILSRHRCSQKTPTTHIIARNFRVPWKRPCARVLPIVGLSLLISSKRGEGQKISTRCLSKCQTRVSLKCRTNVIDRRTIGKIEIDNVPSDVLRPDSSFPFEIRQFGEGKRVCYAYIFCKPRYVRGDIEKCLQNVTFERLSTAKCRNMSEWSLLLFFPAAKCLSNEEPGAVKVRLKIRHR